jgi:hypothetical protein
MGDLLPHPEQLVEVQAEAIQFLILLHQRAAAAAVDPPPQVMQ